MSQQTPIDSIGLNRDQTQTPNDADEKSIRAILHRMIEAWNAGDGTAFAAPFTDDVDFVVWEGTHLGWRQELAVFTQQIFDTVVKGSRLEGEVKFVRFLSSTLAVMHSVVRTTLAGQTKPLPSRDSMELGANKPPASRLQIDVLSAGGLAEESVYHLDVAGHSDMRVSLQRLIEQLLRFLAIT